MKTIYLLPVLIMFSAGTAFGDTEGVLITAAGVAVPNGGYVGDGMTYELVIYDDDLVASAPVYIEEYQTAKSNRSPILGYTLIGGLPSNLSAEATPNSHTHSAGVFAVHSSGAWTDPVDLTYDTGTPTTADIVTWECDPALTAQDGIPIFNVELLLGEGNTDYDFKVALAGDCVGSGGGPPDGFVGFNDMNHLSTNFGKAAPNGWTDGDFDYSGTVDFADFLILSANWGRNVFAANFGL